MKFRINVCKLLTSIAALCITYAIANWFRRRKDLMGLEEDIDRAKKAIDKKQKKSNEKDKKRDGSVILKWVPPKDDKAVRRKTTAKPPAKIRESASDDSIANTIATADSNRLAGLQQSLVLRLTTPGMFGSSHLHGYSIKMDDPRERISPDLIDATRLLLASTKPKNISMKDPDNHATTSTKPKTATALNDSEASFGAVASASFDLGVSEMVTQSISNAVISLIESETTITKAAESEMLTESKAAMHAMSPIIPAESTAKAAESLIASSTESDTSVEIKEFITPHIVSSDEFVDALQSLNIPDVNNNSNKDIGYKSEHVAAVSLESGTSIEIKESVSAHTSNEFVDALQSLNMPDANNISNKDIIYRAEHKAAVTLESDTSVEIKESVSAHTSDEFFDAFQSLNMPDANNNSNKDRLGYKSEHKAAISLESDTSVEIKESVSAHTSDEFVDALQSFNTPDANDNSNKDVNNKTAEPEHKTINNPLEEGDTLSDIRDDFDGVVEWSSPVVQATAYLIQDSSTDSVL